MPRYELTVAMVVALYTDGRLFKCELLSMLVPCIIIEVKHSGFFVSYISVLSILAEVFLLLLATTSSSTIVSAPAETIWRRNCSFCDRRNCKLVSALTC